MTIKASLLRLYFFLEGLYYSVADALQRIGLPMYGFFINPLEKRGIPSFPVALIAMLAIATFALWWFTRGAELAVFVYRAGERLDGALVIVESDNYALAWDIAKGGKATFSVPFKPLRVSVEYGGMVSIRSIVVKEGTNIVRFELP